MAVLAIAGSGRGAGKTAVACALIAAMPELQWTAVKVSPHRHQTSNLEAMLLEEGDRNSDKDTGRYLAAGAVRAFLLSAVFGVEDGDALLAGMDGIRSSCGRGALLMESNQIKPSRVARIGEPALTLAVLSHTYWDWKPSLQWVSPNALVLSGGLMPELLPSAFRGKRVFCLPKDRWVTSELVEFVRRSLKV